ncbi:hypothetical protein K4L44_00250 [Halosquirtibacter laminarini]|uniref:Uncharacterized protein n=1 Tax=Halosquirtibacter laminarini TaxID=3374600 RepID=A0AC61NJC3_9BACT|nr:hypothetical protein K4L44_00250 [Prolixibacteraceae bacterium]
MLKRDGTNQRHRHQVFDPNRIVPDEHSFEQLLSETLQFSKDVIFSDKEVWSDFWESDELFTFVDIITYDVKLLEEKFLKSLQEHSIVNGEQKLHYSLRFVYELSRQVIHWHSKLVVCEYSFNSEMAEVVLNTLGSILGNIIQKMKETILQIPEFVALDVDWDALVYHERKALILLEKEIRSQKQGIPSKLDQLVDEFLIQSDLKYIFYLLYNTINFLKKIAPKAIKESLSSQNHAAHIGLFVTFLRLYEYPQKELNKFTERLQNFYYDEVLQVKPFLSTPDSAFLSVVLKRNVDHVTIPQGTRFATDDERWIYYTTEEVSLNRAKVEHLYRQRLVRKEEIEPSQRFETIELEKLTMDGSKPIKPVNGFLVADEILLLREGNRNITIQFVFTIESYRRFLSEVQRVRGNYQQDDFIEEIFVKSFLVEATAEEGWIALSHHHVRYTKGVDDGESMFVEIELECPASTPAIVPFCSEIHGRGFNIKHPAVKFSLIDNSFISVYPLLELLVLEFLEIKVVANGLTDLLVKNNQGEMDLTSPFDFLGVVPLLHSSVVIGSFELLYKKNLQVVIDIHWNNIGIVKGGIDQYYKEYPEIIENDSFQCRFSRLDEYEWYHKEEAKSLFETEINQYRIEMSDRSRFVTTEFNWKGNNTTVLNQEDYGSHLNSSFGFFKLELVSPSMGFGHKQYPLLLSESFLHNARTKIGKKVDLPKEPFTPECKRIELSYVSKTKINSKDRERFYHFNNWGEVDVVERKERRLPHLIVPVVYDSTLFIGIKSVAPLSYLNILFCINQTVLYNNINEYGALYWHYLDNKIWKPMDQSMLLQDQTHHFTNSGIVKLHIPAHVDGDSKLFNDECFWVRVSVNDSFSQIEAVEKVLFQAFSVKWLEGEVCSQLRDGLPAFSINKAKPNIYELESVTQPLRSFGGRPREEKKDVRVRISEQLVHKGRAITVWDYERLILKKFSHVYKVKCFPHYNSEGSEKPGNILIVAIGQPNAVENNTDLPLLTFSQLKEIERYIKTIAPPQVLIHVRNPIYEHIYIRCAVKFVSPLRNGHFVKLLNEELIKLLSSWSVSKLGEPGFDKDIKMEDIIGFIHDLDFVSFVTDFSTIKITCLDNGEYFVTDSVMTHNEKMTPSVPWGILVSAHHHDISVTDSDQVIDANITGISDLDIQDSFIIE